MKRKIFLLKILLWVLMVGIIPQLFVYLGFIPSDATFLPRLILALGAFPLFLSKITFRVASLAVLGASLLCLYEPPFLKSLIQGLDHKVRDTFFTLRGPLPPSRSIVIVDIDQKSLEEVGQWPFPRAEIANSLRSILADGAKVVGFDVVFAEPDRLSLKEWVQRLRMLGADVDLGVNDERGEIYLEPHLVQQLVIDDWQRFFQEREEDFIADSLWSMEEAREATIEYYLKFQKKKWREEQELQALRAEHAGRAYTPKPYTPPENPLRSMAEKSRELFALSGEGGRGDFIKQGARLVLDNDQALADVFSEGKVVAGGLFVLGSTAGSRVGLFHRQEALDETQGMVLSHSIQGARETFPGMYLATQQITNVQKLQSHAQYQGAFNIMPDRSGAARHYALLIEAPIFLRTLVLKKEAENLSGLELLNTDNYETRVRSQKYTYPTLGLEMFRAGSGFDQLSPQMDKGQRFLVLSNQKGDNYPIHVDHKCEIPLHFLGYGGPWQPEHRYGPEYFMSYISFSDVLFRRFPEGTFKDKYVIIGSTAPTLSDHVGSPFRASFPGIEVHATILDNLIEGRLLRDLGDTGRVWTLLTILFGGLLLTAIVSYSEAWIASLVTFIVLIGVPTASYAAFVHSQLAIDFVFPWLTAALITAIAVMTNFFIEGRERRFVSTQFGKMVSPEVLKRLRQDSQGILLSGQRCKMTVMFSDLEGFTTIAESMEVQNLVRLINEYLTPMSNIIMKHEGFIDKFIGDAIMAIWGVPHKNERQAFLACGAALEQQEQLRKLGPIFEEKYEITLHCRIGIATGEACAALMGSESRKSYTVIGDTVNLSARLEPASKDYGVGILIAGETYEVVKDEYIARCLDKLIVKGRSTPVTVYELIGLRSAASEAIQKKIHLFEDALKAHWERQWESSILLLDQLLQLFPDDEASLALKRRIQRYRENPPPEKWQGEFLRMTKD